jgi:hypothetical protein
MRVISLFVLIFFLNSCSSGDTLQHYFVEKSDDTDFLVTDFSFRNLKNKAANCTPEEEQALEVFSKINVLTFNRNNQNTSKYEIEQEKVQALLKKELYQELMHVGGKKSGGALYYIGNADAPEEFVLYGYQENTGFTVVRLLGANMTPDKIFNTLMLLKKANITNLATDAFSPLLVKQQ